MACYTLLCFVCSLRLQLGAVWHRLDKSVPYQPAVQAFSVTYFRVMSPRCASKLQVAENLSVQLSLRRCEVAVAVERGVLAEDPLFFFAAIQSSPGTTVTTEYSTLLVDCGGLAHKLLISLSWCRSLQVASCFKCDSELLSALLL